MKTSLDSNAKIPEGTFFVLQLRYNSETEFNVEFVMYKNKWHYVTREQKLLHKRIVGKTIEDVYGDVQVECLPAGVHAQDAITTDFIQSRELNSVQSLWLYLQN